LLVGITLPAGTAPAIGFGIQRLFLTELAKLI
jgi:hypothetical protein